MPKLLWMASSNSHNHSALEAHNLTVFYGKKPALWEVDFSIPTGAITGIIGPNGSGKSTLLKSAMGLIDIASGFIKILGEPVEKVRHQVSYVPQKESVDWDFPITAEQVVQMGRYKPGRLTGRLSKMDKEVARNAMERLQVADLANRHISQLSGGQQQRIFLARSLAQEAEIYFMDEPFTGVDVATEQIIIELVKELTASGKSVIMVHHDLSTVPAYFDNVVMLNTRLIASGATDQVFTQENLAAAFGGQLDILSTVSHMVVKENYPVREQGHQEE